MGVDGMEDRTVYYGLPLLKFLAFYFFVFACLLPFGIVADFDLIDLSQFHPIVGELISQLVAIIVVVGGLLMSFQTFKTYYFDEVFISKSNVFAGFGKGALLGIFIIMACAVLAMVFGNVVFSLATVKWDAVMMYTLLFIMVAVFEEFLFRSFSLIVLAERYPLPFAILVTSLLFGLAHLANPGFTWLAMVNITLAGVLLAVIILVKRNIFWAVGLHFGWNFTQGVLLGYQVSGTDSPGILSAKPMGSVYLSGGDFGIESSAYCAVVLIGTLTYLLLTNKIQAVGEEEPRTLIDEIK